MVYSTRGEVEGLLNKDVNYQAHVVGKVQRCIDTTDNLLRISKELWEKMPSGAFSRQRIVEDRASLEEDNAIYRYLKNYPCIFIFFTDLKVWMDWR